MDESTEDGCDLLQVEELPLELLVDLEWQLDQVNWGQNSLLNCEGAFVTGHVSVDIPRATDIHLKVPLFHLLVAGQGSMPDVNTQLGHSVAPFGPAFILVVSISHSLLKFLNQLENLLLGNPLLLPSLLKILIGDFSKGHLAGG